MIDFAWLESRNDENLANFFSKELQLIKNGRVYLTSKKTRQILIRGGLVEINRGKWRDGPVIFLTEKGLKLLEEVSK